MTTSTPGRIRAAFDPASRLTVDLPGDAAAGRVARRAVSELADDLHPETLAKLRLLVTELVVAAVDRRQHPMRLTVDLGEGQIRAALEPASREDRTPHSRRPRDYGLFLVERLAACWEETGDGGIRFELEARDRRRASRSRMLTGRAPDAETVVA